MVAQGTTLFNSMSIDGRTDRDLCGDAWSLMELPRARAMYARYQAFSRISPASKKYRGSLKMDTLRELR